MKSLSKLAIAAAAALTLVASPILTSAPAEAAQKKEFKVAWSIYVGWMPWGYAQEHGIVKKWADKYGLKIEVVQFNDYIESINQYTAGSLDGVLATNMDALAIPSVGGVDTTALIVGDYSNGNDAIILKDKSKLEDIKGQKVNLVELSVSHYTLARALETVGLSEKDVTVVNTSDADMEAAWKTDDVTAMVTWNPMVASILKDPKANSVFDSSAIPGEIQDLLVVNTETLADNPDFGKAMVGIWFETLALMQDGEAGAAARTEMATASGTDLAGYDGQLSTTKMFWTPEEMVAFTTGDLVPVMDKVRNFLFTHGLLGNNAPSADVVGIEFADGKIIGDANNVKFRFTDKYMKLAAEGKL
tara:strand:- start:237245 stop:238321 length:1077 start_codon:yes stop_codon:yes gene_type:complete